MSRVITFSRTFPSYHPRSGKPTYFVEKILKSLDPHSTYYISECEWCGWRGMSSLLSGCHSLADTGDYDDARCPKCGSNKVDESDENALDIVYYNQDKNVWSKYHTIRAGHRWKVGDKFSPRVWSGKPRQSKQIVIAPDIEIVKTWDVEVDEDGCLWVYTQNEEDDTILEHVAKNDGLSLEDLLSWFVKPMVGQIICWNKNVNY